MPGFSNAVQPGQTRYPNMLPKPPGAPVPQGFYLAELADTDIHGFYACIDEAVAEYIEHFEQVAKTYKLALGIRREPNREKRLAMYMLKPAQMWVEQRFFFPGPSDIFPNFAEDWKDYTELVQAAAEGVFDDSQIVQQASTRGPQAFGQAQIGLATGQSSAEMLQSILAQQQGVQQ